jgi:hypothetical protein
MCQNAVVFVLQVEIVLFSLESKMSELPVFVSLAKDFLLQILLKSGFTVSQLYLLGCYSI